MANDPNDEAQWWAEFEQFGEESVRDSLHDGLFPEAKRQLAYRWLGAEAQKRLSLSETYPRSGHSWRHRWHRWHHWDHNNCNAIAAMSASRRFPH
jgi:hypothetical protein